MEVQNRALFLNAMSRVSWGAIWAGIFVAMFFQLLLGLLGLAVGLTAIDVDQRINTTGIGVATGIWMLITTLVAVFLGSFTAGRLAGLSAKYDGLLHGVVTLAFLVVLSLFLATSGISSAIGGAFSLTLNAARVPQVQQIMPTGPNVQNIAGPGQQTITPAQRQQIARRAQAVATRTSWWTFFVGFFSLIIAMLGGYIGMQSRVNQIIRETA
jgi:hypothetical protein